MKKIWFTAFSLILFLALSACSGNSSKSSTDKSSKADSKTALMNFYMNLTNKINAQDRDLNAYEQAIAKTDDKPTAKELAALKTSAQTSAANVADELKNISVPKSLDTYNTQIKSALKDLQSSYQLKADVLKEAKPSLDTANQKFTKANGELGKVFKKAGLSAASLPDDVNS